MFGHRKGDMPGPIGVLIIVLWSNIHVNFGGFSFSVLNWESFRFDLSRPVTGLPYNLFLEFLFRHVLDLLVLSGQQNQQLPVQVF